VAERTADGKEWNATVYHRVARPHLTWGASVIDRVPVRGPETVLDAGCGTGRLTAELLEKLPAARAIAFDRSWNMLEQARAFLEPTFGDRVSYRQGDLQAIDIEMVGEQVDGIFSTATFHWILDHPRLFAGLFSVLKPDGWFEAQCGGGPNLKALLDRVAAMVAEEPFKPYFEDWPGPWNFADAETTIARLEAAGFVEADANVVEAPTVLPDEATYRDFLTNVIFGSHLARLPNDELKTSFIERLIALGATDEPPFSLDYWRLNLRGRKP
jgi:trans-aconitate methyltransferase